ncbi:Ig-like domain-containing protein [Myxococcus sp. K15C18031901]|nr:Ig-like domain-containing protein [Myxococcus dinghuensis]
MTAPAANAKVGTNGVVFRGTNPAGTTVTLTVNGVTVGPVTADTTTTWSTGTFIPLSSGQNTLVVTVTDDYGNTSTASRAFDVSLTAPSAPTVTAPAVNAKVGSSGIAFRGTNPTGSTVTLAVNGTAFSPVTADTATTWSTGTFIPTVSGQHTLVVTVTDAYGNTNTTSRTFDVGLSAPDAPTVTAPAVNAKVGTNGVGFRGTNPTGTTVTLTVNGTAFSPVTADTATTWSTGTFIPTTTGQNTLVVTATDGFGNTSTASRAFDVSLTAPSAPTVTAPVVNTKVGTNGVVFRGTNPTGTTVTLTVNGVAVSPVTADSATTWSTGTFIPTTPGQNTLVVTVTDAYGNTSTASRAFDVSLTAPSAPTVMAPVVNAKVGSSGIAFRGTNPTGTTVTLAVNGTAFGPVTADTATTWSTGTFIPTTTGQNTLVVTVTDAYGNTSTASRAFDVSLTAPSAPTVTAPAVNAKVGSNGIVFRGTNPTGTTVTLTVNGTAFGPVTADTATTWSTARFTPTTTGQNTLVVTVTDAYGNTSTASRSFDVSLTAPSAPTVTAPTVNQRVGSTGVAFRGTNPAGTTVTLTVNGTAFSPITAESATAWSTDNYIPTTPGQNTLVVTVTDAYGNTSTASRAFDVSLTAPNAPSVTAPVANTKVGTSGVALRGTNPAGTTVTLAVNGVAVSPVTADSATTWSVSKFTPTSAGQNTLVVTATDDYGNTNTASRSFDVKLALPAQPQVTIPGPNAKVGATGTRFEGTNEAGTTVTLTVDGQSFGPITTVTATTWSTPTYVPTTPGTHTVTVTVTDDYGNVNTASRSFDAKLSQPAQPSVTFPEANAKVGSTGTRIEGTNEAGTTVTLTVNGQSFGPITTVTATTWSTPTYVPTSPGLHTIVVTVTDAYGNANTVSHPFDVKLSQPDAPTVTSPGVDAKVGSNGIVFRGTNPAGTTVTIRANGQSFGPVTADTATTWSTARFIPTTAGLNTVVVTATDAFNNVSTASRTFDVKLSHPATPQVTSPANGTKVGRTGITFNGTNEAGAKVTLTVNGQNVSPIIVNTATSWSTNTFVPTASGTNRVSVIASDDYGNESAPATLDLDVKITDPSAPIVVQPAHGAKVGRNGTQVRGTADLGTTVRVTIAGVLVGDKETNSGSEWSFGVYTAAPAGSPLVRAVATDAYGNTSAPTEFTIDVNLTQPLAPVITSPTVIAGTWWVGKQGIDVKGTTTLDSTLKLLRETSSGDVTIAELPKATSDQWVVSVKTTDPTAAYYLPAGIHVLKAMVTDAYGNTSAVSNRVPVEVDITDPTVPVISTPAQDSWVALARPELVGTADGNTVQVRVTIDGIEEPALVPVTTGTWRHTVSKTLSEGEHRVRISALDGALNESPLSAERRFRVELTRPIVTITEPANGALLIISRPVFKGTTNKQTQLKITLDGNPTVTIDSTGDQWSYTPPADLDGGGHVFTVKAVDLAQQESEPRTVSFNIDLEAPSQPTVTYPGSNEWISTRQPTLRGTADADCTLTVLIDNEPLTANLRPGVQGTWTYRPSTLLAQGTRTVQVLCKDAQGRDSTPSEPRTFRIVIDGPAKPIIVSPLEGAILGPGFNTLSGTAEPGTTVTAQLNGVDVGSSVVAGPAGDWELEIHLALRTGSHALVAQAKNLAGIVGDNSDARNFRLDFDKPVTQFVDAPSGIVKRTSVTFSLGATEEVAQYECSLDGAAFAACTASITFRDLAEGPHWLEVRATDLAGNLEDPPARRDWTVMRPSTVEGGGVGCAASGAGVPSVVAWLAWIGLLGLRRRRQG